MSRHLERLLQIDALLRCGQRQSSLNLAEALEVSERTIRSDLAFLRDRYHAPLEYSKKTGWQCTDPTWRLPSISLSKGELFALTLGARMLESTFRTSFCSIKDYEVELDSDRYPQLKSKYDYLLFKGFSS
jgi:predicted DNA-binding transcriptional regulator YafY